MADAPTELDPQLQILGALRQLRERAYWTAFAHGLLRAGFWGCFAALPLALAPGPLTPVALALLVSGLVVGTALWAQLRVPSDLALAKAYDDRLGLKDRLSTSLDLIARGDPREAVLRSTLPALETFQPEALYPLRVPREGKLLPLPLLILLAALILPGVAQEAVARDPALAEALAGQAERIRRFASREEGGEATPGQQERRRRLEELAEDLTRKPLSKKDALAKFAELLDELKKEQEQLKLEQERLKRRVKNFKPRQKDKQLVDDVHRGNYQAAANRIKKMIADLQEKIRKAKEKGKKGLEELKKLEEELKKLQDVEAKLLRLMALRRHMDGNAGVLDFLQQVEGELGELDDPEVIEGEFKRLGKLRPPGQGQQQGKIRKVKRRLVRPNNKAGRGTTDEWLGKEARRSEGQREERKLKVRETKGQSAFTQTQVANDGSRSGVEAKKVIEASKRAAEDTIQRQDVPAGDRGYLRRYFEGLQPDAESESGSPAEAPPQGRE